MIKNFEEVKAQLRELADVINAFKSEAVQLRLVDLVFNAVSGEEIQKESPKDEPHSPSGRGSSRRKRRRPTPIANSSSGDTAKTRSTSRPGGKATLARLLSDGFFKKPKTIGQIVEHCDHNLALKYAQSDFSGRLARYVRDGQLRRTKNTENQYEYSQG